MEIRIGHELPRADALERLRRAMRRADLDEDTAGPDEFSGRVLKRTPLGAVEGEWRVEETFVVVVVSKKPAWLPEAAIRQPLEQGLRDALIAE